MADLSQTSRALTPKELMSRLDRIQDWPRVQSMLDDLKSGGYRSYLVGGAVRDLVLGKIPDDADILTDAGPDNIRGLFRDRKVRYVGKSFGVSLVEGVEVASCRASLAPGGQAGRDGNFPEDDLAMRDLTVNSMGMDPFSGELVDPFGGRQDLADRIVRFTLDASDRIVEDPLRMVRACRFAAKLRGTIAQDSFEAIEAHRRLLGERAAPERVQAELVKAMAMDCPSRFFVLLHDTGMLAGILPCLDRCHGLDGGPHHGETVFEHCMLVGDALPAGRPLLRLAGYLHDTGKFDAAEIKNKSLTFAGHETRDAALARDLEALRFSRQDTAYILSLFRAHMRPLNDESTPRAVRRLLAMLDDLGVDYRDFMRMRIADKKANLAKRPYTLSEIRLRLGKLLAELNPGTALCINDLAITGREICSLLGIQPGPRVGRIKHHLFEQVLADPSLNTPEGLACLVRKTKI